MDEFRPYPTEFPPDAAEEAEEDAEDAGEDAGAEEEHAQPGMAAGYTERPASTHPERQAPNVDHPGGHLHGTVARLNRPRRFGFLRADDGAEIFFHASAIDTGPSAFDALRPGQEVEFDCHQDEQGRGLAASLVTVTGEPPAEAPRQPRAPRAERGERAERQGRAERGERAERGGRGQGAGAHGWHVTVLRDRFDQPAAAQLERLLNERNVKPGSFTLALLEAEEGAECWVAYHTGTEPKS